MLRSFVCGATVLGCAQITLAYPLRFDGTLAGDSVVLDPSGIPIGASPASLDFAFTGGLRHSDPLTAEWDGLIDEALTTLQQNPMHSGGPPASGTIFSAPLMAPQITGMHGDVASESIGVGLWRHDIVLTLVITTTLLDAPGGSPVGIYLGSGSFRGSFESSTPTFLEYFDAPTVRHTAIQFAADGPFVSNEAGDARSDALSWVFPASTFTLTVPAPGVIPLGVIAMGVCVRRRR